MSKNSLTEAQKEFLNNFQRKAVQGLYSYDHFERADGSWIQMSARRDSFVFLDARNNHMSNFFSLKELVEFAMS